GGQSEPGQRLLRREKRRRASAHLRRDRPSDRVDGARLSLDGPGHRDRKARDLSRRKPSVPPVDPLLEARAISRSFGIAIVISSLPSAAAGVLFFGITLLAVALVIPEGLLKSPRMKRLALFRALAS